MKKILNPFVVVMGIFLGLATVNTFSGLNNYAYAAESQDSQTEQDTGDNQTTDNTSNQSLKYSY
jgi:hypothetical protein